MTISLMGCVTASPKTIVVHDYCSLTKPLVILPSEYKILSKNKHELHNLLMQLWQNQLKYKEYCK
jgi:hypothetical protein